MVNEPDMFADPRVMRACNRAAGRVSRVNKRYVEHADVLSEMYVWVLKNEKYVREWLEDGQHGLNKLGVALFRAGHTYTAKERIRITGGKDSDFYYYTPGVLEELLPDLWQYDAWDNTPAGDSGMPRGKSKPGEGGNRRAMMVDVSYAVGTLPVDDQRLLHERFAPPGCKMGELGRRHGVTEDGMRKKVTRLLGKLVDRLGGEPPMWYGGRRARSNASTQSELRSNNA